MSEPSDDELADMIEERLGAYAAESGEDGVVALGAAARAIERTWDLVIPRRLLAEVRDRRELVEACVARVRRHLRLRGRRRPLPHAAPLKVRIEPPVGRAVRGITRSGTVTAYDAEELLDGVRRWGPGGRIDVVVTDDRGRAMVEALVDRAGALAISVRRAPAAR